MNAIFHMISMLIVMEILQICFSSHSPATRMKLKNSLASHPIIGKLSISQEYESVLNCDSLLSLFITSILFWGLAYISVTNLSLQSTHSLMQCPMENAHLYLWLAITILTYFLLISHNFYLYCTLFIWIAFVLNYSMFTNIALDRFAINKMY